MEKWPNRSYWFTINYLFSDVIRMIVTPLLSTLKSTSKSTGPPLGFCFCVICISHLRAICFFLTVELTAELSWKSTLKSTWLPFSFCLGFIWTTCKCGYLHSDCWIDLEVGLEVDLEVDLVLKSTEPPISFCFYYPKYLFSWITIIWKSTRKLAWKLTWKST